LASSFSVSAWKTRSVVASPLSAAEHSGPDGGPVEVKQYTDIEAGRLIGRFLQKVAGPPKTGGGPLDLESAAEVAGASPPKTGGGST
jgi:hypothetical protein